MASIKITVSRGGWHSQCDDYTSQVDRDMIEIDVPIPDRAGAQLVTSEYLRIIESTFDKTGELVDMVRGTVDDLSDIEIGDADDEAAPEPHARAVRVTHRVTGDVHTGVQDTVTGLVYRFGGSPNERAAEFNRGELSFSDGYEPISHQSDYDIEAVPE